MHYSRHLLALSVVAAILATVGIARAATDLPNLALKKTATASASQDGNPPENAVDGNADTRWCNAGAATGAWLQIDLEKAQPLGGCEITWEHDGAVYKYVVEGSADGKTWTPLNDQRGTTAATQQQKLALAGDPVRYVRITVTGLDDGSWASICELKLFDTESMSKLTPDEAKTYRPSAPEAPTTAPASAPAK